MSNSDKNIPIYMFDCDYSGKYHVVVSLNCGFCSRFFSFNNDEEIFEANQAFASILAQYIEDLYSRAYDKELQTDVSQNCTSFAIDADKDSIAGEIEDLYSILYNMPEDRDLFENSKRKAISKFKDKYKNINYRALCRLYEFAESGKEFSFKKFTRDIISIDAELFMLFMDLFVRPQNSILIIAGNSSEISPFPELNLQHRETQAVIPLLSFKNKSEPPKKEDHETVIEDLKNNKMGCLKLNFQNTKTSVTLRYFLTELIAQILFGFYYLVSVDSLDASIVYWNRELTELKYDYINLINAENIKVAQITLLNRMKRQIEQNPNSFFIKTGRQLLSGIGPNTFVEMLENTSEQTIKLWIKESGLFITEAQLIQKKYETAVHA